MNWYSAQPTFARQQIQYNEGLNDSPSGPPNIFDLNPNVTTGVSIGDLGFSDPAMAESNKMRDYRV